MVKKKKQTRRHAWKTRSDRKIHQQNAQHPLTQQPHSYGTSAHDQIEEYQSVHSQAQVQDDGADSIDDQLNDDAYDGLDGDRLDEASTTKLNGVESTDDGDDNDDSFEVPTETVHVDRVSGRLKRTAALQANERMASQALESRGIKATQDAAVSGRTTRTRRAAASNPRKRNASPESDEESDEAASNSVVPWVSPNQVFNIAYIDEEIARLSSKVLPADPRLPLVHGPTGGKTVKLPTPDTSMITRCFEERGKVYLGGLLNWLKSASVLPTLNLWFDECFPNDRIRAQLENLLPLDATSWDDQLEAIVALAKRNDIAAIVPTPENYATYLCAMYTRKLLLRNVERIRINSSGGGIYLAFRAVYLPAAIILTAYYDFHTKPNGFFATLLDSPLARPMRAELREEYGSLFELSITQGYAKDRSTFFQITSRGVPAVRPFGNPALTSYQKDLMPVLFDDTEQLTFFTAFRDYLQGLLSGYDAEDWEAETSICEILVMRTRDECLSFNKTNKNKLKLAASQAAGRGVGLGSSEASTQSTARGDTTSSGVSKRLATQTTAPLPPSDRDTRPMPTVQHAMALVNLGANSWTPAQISSSAPPISSGVTARAPITDVPSSSNSQGDANERARASVTGAAGLRQYVPPPPLRPSNTTAAFGSKSQGNADERARASAVGAVGLHQYVPPQPLCLSNTSAATGLRSQGDANERARASVTGAAILQQYVPPPPLHPIDTSSEGQGPSTSEGKSPRLPPKEEANRMRARVEFYQEKVIETQEAVKKAREETTDALEDDEKPQIAREDAAEARVKLRNKEWSEEQYLKGLKDSQQES